MFDLWLAISFSAVLVITAIYYSVNKTINEFDGGSSDKDNQSVRNQSTANKKADNKLLLLFPIVFLLSSILLYSQNPTVELQQNWLNTQIETKYYFDLSEQNLTENKHSKADIQSMLLGLRTLVHKESNNADLWFILAESYFQLSMVDLADESMKRAIRLKPSANWYVAYAQILALRSSESDLNRAVGFLGSAIKLDPSHQSAMLTMGFLYARQQKYAQAIDIWSYLANEMDKNDADSTRIRQQIESLSTKKLNTKPTSK